ncbi:copper transporter [Pseudonocardia nematodicida]|uniref:Copper transporter n=1 Tax=Pseudonocardia nematodicida TaxID=1206997 RepID=A0ABV1K5F6_9PSEU
MISRRHHRTALVAVFVLAMALGVVVATLGVPQRIAATATSAAGTGETGEVEALRAERDQLVARLEADDAFAARIGPRVLDGALTGVPVTVVSIGADEADTRAIAELITVAGGTVAGDVVLTPAVTDPARADQLRDLSARLLPAGAQLPASSDAGALAGGLLGSALLAPGADPGQAGAVVAGLAAGGFAEEPAGTADSTAAEAPVGTGTGQPGTAAESPDGSAPGSPGGAPGAGELAVVVTGGALPGVDAGDAAATAAALAAELDLRGGGAVLVGRDGSATPQGAVGAARANPGSLSTVDDVGTGAGRIATVLALAERAAGDTGQYGSGEGASGPVPGPREGAVPESANGSVG